MTKFFNEDRHNGPLSIRDIKYLLLFRELPTRKELGASTKNKILSKCVDYYLENYSKYSNIQIEMARSLMFNVFEFSESRTFSSMKIQPF